MSRGASLFFTAVACAVALTACGSTHTTTVTKTVTKTVATVPAAIPTMSVPGESTVSFRIHVDGKPSSCRIYDSQSDILVLFYARVANVRAACAAMIKFEAAALGSYWSVYRGVWGAQTPGHTACELRDGKGAATDNAVVVDPSGSRAAANVVCAELAAGGWT